MRQGRLRGPGLPVGLRHFRRGNMEKTERTSVEGVPGIVEVGFALSGMAMQLLLVTVVMGEVV